MNKFAQSAAALAAGSLASPPRVCMGHGPAGVIVGRAFSGTHAASPVAPTSGAYASLGARNNLLAIHLIRGCTQ
jgi:hypothetical protein